MHLGTVLHKGISICINVILDQLFKRRKLHNASLKKTKQNSWNVLLQHDTLFLSTINYIIYCMY